MRFLRKLVIQVDLHKNELHVITNITFLKKIVFQLIKQLLMKLQKILSIILKAKVEILNIHQQQKFYVQEIKK